MRGLNNILIMIQNTNCCLSEAYLNASVFHAHADDCVLKMILQRSSCCVTPGRHCLHPSDEASCPTWTPDSNGDPTGLWVNVGRAVCFSDPRMKMQRGAEASHKNTSPASASLPYCTQRSAATTLLLYWGVQCLWEKQAQNNARVFA